MRPLRTAKTACRFLPLSDCNPAGTDPAFAKNDKKGWHKSQKPLKKRFLCLKIARKVVCLEKNFYLCPLKFLKSRILYDKMTKTKILFINTEMSPYMPESRMAEIGRKLPQGMLEAGHEIRTFVPRFGVINERRNQLHEVIRLSGLNLVINERDHPLVIKVASIQPAKMQVYFIDNDDYFTHRGEFGDKHGEYDDNAERALFYTRGVAETICKLRWVPDVVVCQGWFSAIAPIYIKKKYSDDPCFKRCKIVTALYNDAYTKPLSPRFAQMLRSEGIAKADVAEIKDKPMTHTTLCKFALKYSDGVIVTEEGIDPELLDYANAKGCKVLTATDEVLDKAKYDAFLEEFHAEE